MSRQAGRRLALAAKPIVLAVLMVGGVPTAACAQAAPDAGDREEVEQLKAQVRVLQQRLDRLEATRVTPAAATPSTAAVAAAPLVGQSATPDRVPATRIGGKAYLNVSGIRQRLDGAPSPQDGVQAELKRFYLTVDHTFSHVFSANLTTDFRYGTNGLSRDDALFVKKAYLQAALAPELFVRIGSADMPWIPFVEGVYGYRFVETTLINRTKYGAAADWGLHVGGSLGGGRISYALSAVNGAGFQTLSRSSNTVDLEGRISAHPTKEIVFALGGYTGKLGKSADGGSVTEHRARRFDALAAYAGKVGRFGIEYFKAWDWNNVTTPESDTSSGWSAFGSYAFTPRLGVFGRYDWVNPDQETNRPFRERYFNFGFDYRPVENVDLALVYKRDRADAGLIPTTNGTIGGLGRGTYDEIGVWSQFSF